MNRLLCRKFMGLGASQLLKPALPREAAIYATVQFPRHSSTVPPAPVDRIRHDIGEKSPTITEVVGLSGRPYLILQVLQEREPPTRRVYLASAGGERFILKDVSQSEFKYYVDIYRALGNSPYVRPLQDTIPEQSMFVYKYLTSDLFSDLLSLVQKDLPIALTKRILQDALRGLAALHDQNIVHTDVKANNIMVDWEEDHSGINIMQVQLTDIEDAAHVPPGCDILGKEVGNEMWRSPEAHAQGRVNRPSDMFSFGVVCIYAVLKNVIFAVGEDQLGEGEVPLAVVLERQVSYFADQDGLDGLLNHLGDNPWCEVFNVIRDGFTATDPRKPFSLWKDVDADFKDLIGD